MTCAVAPGFDFADFRPLASLVSFSADACDRLSVAQKSALSSFLDSL